MNLSREYEDVMRRAELYDSIAEMIKSEAGKSAAAVRKVLTPRLRLEIAERRVVCNGQTLDLARRPVTLKLFQAFCAAPGLRLDRDHVMALLQAPGSQGMRSQRYTESLHNNAIKLISRTRILALTHFAANVPADCEWFVHGQDRRSWVLYRL